MQQMTFNINPASRRLRLTEIIPVSQHKKGIRAECLDPGRLLTSEHAPVVASHTQRTDWFCMRFSQRTASRVLLIQVTMEM